MKTFEERYTAWIDGELEGGALTAFEQELTRRAAAGEASEDKSDATHLRALLQDYLQAPALTNPDFFNHQLQERIDAEATTVSRGRELNRHAEPAFFAWGLARLIGLGAASLFAAAALYYGMMPPHVGSLPNPAVAVSHANAGNGGQVAAADTPVPAPQAPTAGDHATTGMDTFVNRSPTPSPIDLTPDIKVYVPDQPTNPTTITPLHYDKSNVNVLWLNGLDYMPSLPDATGTAPVAIPAPSASANP